MLPTISLPRLAIWTYQPNPTDTTNQPIAVAIAPGRSYRQGVWWFGPTWNTVAAEADEYYAGIEEVLSEGGI